MVDKRTPKSAFLSSFNICNSGISACYPKEDLFNGGFRRVWSTSILGQLWSYLAHEFHTGGGRGNTIEMCVQSSYQCIWKYSRG